MKRLIGVFLVVVFMAVGVSRGDAKKLSKKEKIRLTLGFETFKYWKKAGFIAEKKLVKEGKQAALWTDTEDNERPYTKMLPHDLSGYKAMSIWIYSKTANDAKIAVVFNSEDEDSSGSDYYMMRILINWTGWKKLVIPFDVFKEVRSPVGFNKIDRLRFAATGYKTGGAKEDTELILDDIKFLTAKELSANKKYIYKGYTKKKKKKSKKSRKSKKVKEDWGE